MSMHPLLLETYREVQLSDPAGTRVKADKTERALGFTQSEIDALNRESEDSLGKTARFEGKIRSSEHSVEALKAGMATIGADVAQASRKAANRAAELEASCDEKLADLEHNLSQKITLSANRAVGLEASCDEKLATLEYNLNQKIALLTSRFNGFASEEALQVEQLEETFSGNIVLTPLDAEDISKTELNAAAEGECTREFIATLSYAYDIEGGTGYKTLEWAKFTPTIVATGSVDDADVAAPTVTWKDIPADDPRFVNGAVVLVVTFDTDAGVTKTYDEGTSDSVSIEVKVSATDVLPFGGLTVDSVTKTYNVTA
jgi:hypothetical protein